MPTNKAVAEAWEQGYAAAREDWLSSRSWDSPNPYSPESSGEQACENVGENDGS